MHHSKPVFFIELLTTQSVHLHHWDAPDPNGGSAADICQVFPTRVLTSLGAPGMALQHQKEKVREKHKD